MLLAMGLAVLPPLIDPTATAVQLGLLIGLAGVSAGLLVEQHLRAEDLTDAVRASAQEGATQTANRIETRLAGLTPVFESSQECQMVLRRVARDWQEVEKHGDVPFYREIRSSLATEFTARLSDLAYGAITVSVDSPYTFRASSLRGLRLYRTVTMDGLAFWATPFGRQYLSVQRDAIANGLRLERVFVLRKDELIAARRTVRAHVETGVVVSVVIRELVSQLHHVHLLDRGIATYDSDVKMLVELVSTPSGEFADKERLSIIPADIEAAEEGLLALRRYAQTVEEVYEIQEPEAV